MLPGQTVDCGLATAADRLSISRGVGDQRLTATLKFRWVDAFLIPLFGQQIHFSTKSLFRGWIQALAVRIKDEAQPRNSQLAAIQCPAMLSHKPDSRQEIEQYFSQAA